jgi:hypothetical protein
VKKTVIAAVAACAFVFAATASAALVPGVFDPDKTGCPTATYSHGVLHLAKNCATTTNAAAGADITGLDGQTFQSASFTLASASQCNGGSPRFDVVTTNGTTSTTFFLGCNNVTPTINADGTATYTFTAATLAAAGNQVPFPTGTITSVDILIDVQGTADISNITVNGTHEVPSVHMADRCKHGQWKARGFRNQGQCVSHDRHELNHARQDEREHGK